MVWMGNHQKDMIQIMEDQLPKGRWDAGRRQKEQVHSRRVTEDSPAWTLRRGPGERRGRHGNVLG